MSIIKLYPHKRGERNVWKALTLEEVIDDHNRNPGGHDPPVGGRDSAGEESHGGSKEENWEYNRHDRGPSGGDGETGDPGVRAVRTHSTPDPFPRGRKARQRSRANFQQA